MFSSAAFPIPLNVMFLEKIKESAYNTVSASQNEDRTLFTIASPSPGLKKVFANFC